MRDERTGPAAAGGTALTGTVELDVEAFIWSAHERSLHNSTFAIRVVQ